jgi:hypothetical protein
LSEGPQADCIFKVTALCATEIFGIAREAAATAPVAAAALKNLRLEVFLDSNDVTSFFSFVIYIPLFS